MRLLPDRSPQERQTTSATATATATADRTPGRPARLRERDEAVVDGENGQGAKEQKALQRERAKEAAPRSRSAVVGWVDERTGLGPFARGFMFRKVPKGTNWFYTLGSASMFAFVSQAVTGVFLAMYYRPSADEAYTSIQHINNEVFAGELVRGMHRWGATVMVVLVFLHMGRTFFFGAYKYPRELNWIIGVVLLLLTLMMALTGYLLPFDQRSFWATVVAREHQRVRPDDRALPRRLPARRRRVRGDDDQPLLRAPHAAGPRADRGADRRPPLPGGQARHDRPAVAQGREEARPREGRDLGRMNAREKEQYLREYHVLKSQGKPFFPYAVREGLVHGGLRDVRDHLDGGRCSAPSSAPRPTRRPPPTRRGRSGTSSSCSSCCAWSSRRSWCSSRPIGIPTLCLVLLLLLPFIDRNPERHPLKRPIATLTGIAVIWRWPT